MNAYGMRRFYWVGFVILHSLSVWAQTDTDSPYSYRKGKLFDKVPAYRMEKILDLRKFEGTEMKTEREVPAGQSTVFYEVELPEYTAGLFFSRDYRPGDHSWPNNTNRLLPWAFRHMSDLLREDYPGIPSNGKVLPQGDALFLQLKDGSYEFIKAVAGENSISWLKVEADGKLKVYVSTLGRDHLLPEVPLLLCARGISPYRVLSGAYRLLAADAETAWVRRREDKKWYEPFSYLGWCTWEHYHRNIGQRQLTDDIREIEKSGIPIRYVLIDDGHVRAENERLLSFKPDSVKFASGWEPILSLRKEEKIRWMGLWFGFPGFWEGISQHNDFPPEVKACLYPYGNSVLPGKSSSCIDTYYRYYVESLKAGGFDFLKIDIQSFMLPLYMGATEAVRQARDCNRALEKEAYRAGLGLINCMAQNVINTDNTYYSDVTRVSIDYKKFDEDMARSHILQSYTNALLLGQTVWPDQDMFHSCDSICGGLMARSKALSGGPVYLSDAPRDFVKELIWPLIDRDGRLFRPSAPAVPTPESIFVNPVFSGTAYRVAAPVGEEALAVICYNLNKKAEFNRIESALRREDYLWKGSMTGEKTELPDQLIVYDWEKQQAEKLSGEKKVTLEGFSDRLFYICPVKKGWGIVGIQEKYLSPATVKVISRTENELVMDVLTEGTLKIWEEQGDTGLLRSMKIDEPRRVVLHKTLK